jgi:hypothetical protein
MARYPGFALATMHHRVPAMLGLDLQRSRSWKIVEKSSAFDLRLHDVVIHFIIEIRMTAEKMRATMHPASP